MFIRKLASLDLDKGVLFLGEEIRLLLNNNLTKSAS